MITRMAIWRCWRTRRKSDCVRPEEAFGVKYCAESETITRCQFASEIYLWALTLCASSTTNTLPVSTSARVNRRTRISKRPQADTESMKGSDRSMMVIWPGTNRDVCFGCFFLSNMNAFSRDIRCSSPATCAGLKLRLRVLSSVWKAEYVNFSPKSRRMD